MSDDRQPELRVVEAEEVPPELLEAAVEVADGWYEGTTVSWDDVLDRIDGMEIDGKRVDLGDNMNSPAIRKIKAHVREVRRNSL